MQLSCYCGNCSVKSFYENCSNKINSIASSTLKTYNTNSFLNIQSRASAFRWDVREVNGIR